MIKDKWKSLNITKIRGRIKCINQTKPNGDKKFEKELKEELLFLERLMRYTESFY